MEYWSWILTAVGLTGFVLATNKVWWCWYINIACQALWFTYAVVTEQYGFIVASLAYTVVFTRGAIKWTRERHRIDKIIRDPVAIVANSTASINEMRRAAGFDVCYEPRHRKELIE